MLLIKKNLSLYFCTALFCHVVLLSTLYNWSQKNSAGTQQAPSVTTYLVLAPHSYKSNVARVQSACSVAKPGNYHNMMQQLSTSGDPSRLPTQQHSVKENPLENEHPNYARQAQDDNAKKHHGYSKLLALLHTTIQEHQIYPLRAVTSQQSGTAIVNFTLLPNGNIVNSTLHQSSGYTDLDQAALEAVQAISPFKAITLNVQQHFTVAVSYKLG